MRSRTAGVLMMVAALSLASGWYFGLRTLPDGQREVVAGNLAFPGLAAVLPQAARVEIGHAGQSVAIAKQGDQWGLADKGGYPVDPNKLRELMTGISELRLAEARTSQVGEYPKLGVEDPSKPGGTSNLVRVLDGQGKVLAELIVGHRRVRAQGNTGETVYVRRPGEAQSWLAEGRLPADADPQLWVQRDIADIDPAHITAAVVERDGQTLKFGMGDGGAFTLLSPAEHPALEDYKVAAVSRALQYLTLLDVKPASQVHGAPVGSVTYTLAGGGSVVVSVFQDGKDVWAEFAAKGDGAEVQALQKRAQGWAYQLSSSKKEELVPVLNDLLAPPATAAPKP